MTEPQYLKVDLGQVRGGKTAVTTYLSKAGVPFGRRWLEGRTYVILIPQGYDTGKLEHHIYRYAEPPRDVIYTRHGGMSVAEEVQQEVPQEPKDKILPEPFKDVPGVKGIPQKYLKPEVREKLSPKPIPTAESYIDKKALAEIKKTMPEMRREIPIFGYAQPVPQISKAAVERENEIQRFIYETERAAMKGDPAAWVTYYLGPQFTRADPFGLKTIISAGQDIYEGKFFSGESRLRKVRKEGLREIYGTYFKDTGEPDPFMGSAKFVLQAPTTELALIIGTSYAGGGLLRSAAPVVTGAAAKVPGAVRAGEFLVKHPRLVERTAYGIFGGAEALKIKGMKETGVQDIDIATELGKDLFYIGALGQSFKKGMETGLPLKYSKVAVGEKDLYKGIVLEYGKPRAQARPLIGKTPEGWKVGEPGLKPETIRKIYGPELRSYEGYIPRTPMETRLSLKGVVQGYKEPEALRVSSGLRLRELTHGVRSRFMAGEIPIEDPLKRHGLRTATIKNVRDWVKRQDDIIIYGSTSQKAQMRGIPHREIHDIDITISGAEKKTKELLGIIHKTEPRGKVRISPTSPTLLETKRGHLFDIHDVISGETVASPWYAEEFIGFGFKAERPITIGGTRTFTLSEQATRKLSSSLSLRTGKVDPALHRFKDVLDYPEIERTLIKSMEKSPGRLIYGSRIKEAKEALKMFESTRAAGKTKDFLDDVILYASRRRYVSSPTLSFASVMGRAAVSKSPKPSRDFRVPSYPVSPSRTRSAIPSKPRPSRPSRRPSMPSGISNVIYGSPIPSRPRIPESVYPGYPSRPPSPSPSRSPSSPMGSPLFESPVPSEAPAGPPPFFFLFGAKGKKGVPPRTKGRVEKARYSPSLGALLFGATAKKEPKEVTGMEIFRPFIVGKK